jgi:hypothetical protein
LAKNQCLPTFATKTKTVFYLLQVCTKLYEKKEFQPLDPTQELIFPPELMVCSGLFGFMMLAREGTHPPACPQLCLCFYLLLWVTLYYVALQSIHSF